MKLYSAADLQVAFSKDVPAGQANLLLRAFRMTRCNL